MFGMQGAALSMVVCHLFSENSPSAFGQCWVNEVSRNADVLRVSSNCPSSHSDTRPLKADQEKKEVHTMLYEYWDDVWLQRKECQLMSTR